LALRISPQAKKTGSKKANDGKATKLYFATIISGMSVNTTSGGKGFDLRTTLITAKQYFFYLLKNWKIIILMCVVGGSLGILKATLEKPRYEARLTFALEENKAGLSGALSLAAEFGLSLGSGSTGIFAGDNILAILGSRKMIEEVLLSVDTLNGKPITMADYLIKINRSDKKANAKGRAANVSFPVTMPRGKFSYLQDSVLFVMYEDITKGSLSLKRPDRKLNLYEVKMTTPDERFSKRFVEKLLAATSAYYSQLRTKRSKKTLDELEKMVVNMRSATKSAIQGRASIQDANVNPALAAQGAQLQQKQLDISAYGAAYSELFKNLELARYQYLQDVPLLEVIDYPNYPMKRLKSGRLLTGLTIAFVFGFLTIMGLLIRKIVRDSLNSVPNEGDQSVQASPGT
jgi:uncharacterized protein involved in exopolysaccharide biosynthesis